MSDHAALRVALGVMELEAMETLRKRNEELEARVEQCQESLPRTFRTMMGLFSESVLDHANRELPEIFGEQELVNIFDARNNDNMLFVSPELGEESYILLEEPMTAFPEDKVPLGDLDALATYFRLDPQAYTTYMNVVTLGPERLHCETNTPDFGCVFVSTID